MRATNQTFQVITSRNHSRGAFAISKCPAKGATKNMSYLILVKYDLGCVVKISIHWLVGNHGILYSIMASWEA